MRKGQNPAKFVKDVAKPERITVALLNYIPFKHPAPTRRVALAWRKSFTRPQAIEALRTEILKCKLNEVVMLENESIRIWRK